MTKIPSGETGASAAVVSALRAEQKRMQVIAENIANADSTATKAGGEPYRRQIPVFRPVQLEGATGVAMIGVQADTGPLQTRYEPSNPAADAKGFVKIPNVDPLTEALDMKAAQRAYEANLNMSDTLTASDKKILDVIKK